MKNTAWKRNFDLLVKRKAATNYDQFTTNLRCHKTYLHLLQIRRDINFFSFISQIFKLFIHFLSVGVLEGFYYKYNN